VLTMCSAACALSWICHEALPADLAPNLHRAGESETAA
jgi:hypothetical protein